MAHLLRVQCFTVPADGNLAGDDQRLDRPFGHLSPQELFTWRSNTASGDFGDGGPQTRGIDDLFARDMHHGIADSLTALLGKPIEKSNALVVPTALYPFRGGATLAGRMIRGQSKSPLCNFGRNELGVLELSMLPSIDEHLWMEQVAAGDALLVFGGDVLFLTYWMQTSGLADFLPTLTTTTYVGVSAGSMVATSLIGETYVDPPQGSVPDHTAHHVTFDGPDGPFDRLFVTTDDLGLVDCSIIPHHGHPDHADACGESAALWASQLPTTTYAIGEHAALVVEDGITSVIGDGTVRRFDASLDA